jgi:hypothetical protein
VFTPTTTNGPFIQFDNVGVSPITTTPLPSTWTMLIVGFIGLGLFAHRGTKKNSVALATSDKALIRLSERPRRGGLSLCARSPLSGVPGLAKLTLFRLKHGAHRA